MGLRDIGATLPPGFRFYPSDEELVCHYLYKKIANEDVLKGTLVEIDLHTCEPWQLPGEFSFSKLIYFLWLNYFCLIMGTWERNACFVWFWADNEHVRQGACLMGLTIRYNQPVICAHGSQIMLILLAAFLWFYKKKKKKIKHKHPKIECSNPI